MAKISDERYLEITKKIRAAKNSLHNDQKKRIRTSIKGDDTDLPLGERIIDITEQWTEFSEEFTTELKTLEEKWAEANELMAEIFVEFSELIAEYQEDHVNRSAEYDDE